MLLKLSPWIVNQTGWGITRSLGPAIVWQIRPTRTWKYLSEMKLKPFCFTTNKIILKVEKVSKILRIVIWFLCKRRIFPFFTAKLGHFLSIIYFPYVRNTQTKEQKSKNEEKKMFYNIGHRWKSVFKPIWYNFERKFEWLGFSKIIIFFLL